MPRRACVVNYIADGVLSDTNEPLLNGVPLIEKVLMSICINLKLLFVG